MRPFGGGFRGPNRERASVFSGAGRGRAGGSAVEPGRDQRVQRRGTGRCRWFCGGARRRSQRVQRRRTGRCRGFCGGAGAGPACSAARDRGGTGSSEVQTGRAGRREGGGGMASRPPPRPLPKAAAGCKADGRAAGSQKKCSEGKMRPPPGRKKSVPRGRCAAARTHTSTKKRTSVRSLLFLLLYGLLLRDARPIHPAARQRLRTPGARLFCGRLPAACSPATSCLPSISVCPSVGGHSSESLRHPEPQPLSRPPVGAQPPGRRNLSRPGSPRESRSRSGRPRESLRPPPGSQFSAAGVIVLSRPGSRPSAARNLPSLLLAPSAAGVTAPPRRYGRPPAAGESPASSSRRASPARDSTAYRPAP